MHKLIQEFSEVLKNDPAMTIQATLAPFFIIITWQEVGGHPLTVIGVNKGRDSYMAFNEREYVAIALERLDAYLIGTITMQDLEDEYLGFHNAVKTLYDEVVQKDLVALSSEELRVYMHKLDELMLELVRRTLYIENLDYDKVLLVIGSEKRAILDGVWERAIEPVFMSFENRQRKDLLSLIEKDSKNIVRQAKYMYTDYFWPKSNEEIETSLADIAHIYHETLEDVRKGEAELEKRAELHTEWIQTLDDESRKIAEYAQAVMRFRDIRKDPIAQILAMMAEISVVMLERAHIDAVHAPYILLYEYTQGVEHLATLRESIKFRRDGCVYMTRPDHTYSVEVCNYEKALSELMQICKRDHVSGEPIKGQIACRGKVTGTVRIIVDPKEDKGFQIGDILVTSMTRPEFVPLMKKAGAVVTNEGGITCHAAIVSRELKIPCIIGTKIAMQVLKDGDLVEVDADNGIVTILENN